MSKSLIQFIIEEQRHIPNASGNFTGLLSDVVSACKQIAHDVNKGALIGVLGSAGSENVQGETQRNSTLSPMKCSSRRTNGAATWRAWRPRKWMMCMRFPKVSAR